LGGLGETGIGKNMIALEYESDIIVIDMGLLFPPSDYLGVNYLVPDTSYLEANKHKIRGHIFTHAHLDHIGAFKHLIHRIPAPVYATNFTINMLQRQMGEAPTNYEPRYRAMDPLEHERVQLGTHFSIELVHVLHSIPGCVVVVIRTPVGTLVHMGDWRFESKTLDAHQFDMPRLREIAQAEGITVLMNESTNIDVSRPQRPTEFDIEKSIAQVMDNSPNARIIISCVSSQVYRMQAVLVEAKKYGRKVAFAGYSMVNVAEIALRTQKLKIPPDLLVRMEDIVKLRDDKVTIVCTGGQGELNAVLNRMATGAHKYIKIKKTDVIVLSSSPIPGNEPQVVATVDHLIRQGATVIQHGKTHLHGVGPLHLSGHAFYEDHVKLVQELRPKNYLPIHGEFHMLVHNAEMAENVAHINRDNILVCDSGDVIELDRQGRMAKAKRVSVGNVMYGETSQPVHEVVLKDRLHIGTHGIFMVSLVVDGKTSRLLASPDIVTRACIYVRDNDQLITAIRHHLKRTIAQTMSQPKRDDELLKKELREDITRIVYEHTQMTPMIHVCMAMLN
jgi:ribonuclease J